MTLSKEDGELFYKLWMELLDYVNETYKVNTTLGSIAKAKSIDPNDVKVVADKLWENITVIDDYLKSSGKDLPIEHQEIIKKWKERIRGKFILERHLKSGSIFISMEDEQVYQVSGIISSYEEISGLKKCPLF